MSEQVITLDIKNSIEILCSFIEVAQKAGSFLLSESDILKRCKDVLTRNIQDPEINIPTARNLFIQAINKGQQKGAFTLDDASILHKVCQYVSQNLSVEAPISQSTSQSTSSQIEDSDLHSLSDPVPLRSGPKVI